MRLMGWVRSLALLGVVGALWGVGGCQEPTKPRGGYMGVRSDRGLNIDSESPSIPEVGGAGMGMGPGSDPQGENAPRPAGAR